MASAPITMFGGVCQCEEKIVIPGPNSPRSTTLSTDQLLGIQAARGIAALLVVLFHAGRMLSLPQHVGHIPMGNVFGFGHAGVDFFFVLSGFIITYVHFGDIGQVGRLPRYVWRRVTRVYPIYWVVTAALAIMILLSHDATERLRWDHIVTSLLLIPHNEPPLLGVAWTLEHEMLFYLVFASAILWRPLGVLLAIAGLLLIAAGQADLLSGNFLGFLASLYHLQFLMGCVAAMVVLRCRVVRPRLLALSGIAAFVAVGFAENAGMFAVAGPLSIVLFGTASVAMVIGTAVAERSGTLRVGHLGGLLGAASYSIYLTHTISIALVVAATERLGITRMLPDWLLLLLVVSAAGLAGLALHCYVERPLGADLRRRSDAWRQRRKILGV